MKRGSLPWLIKAISDNTRATVEKPTRDIGGFILRNAVGLARSFGQLPKSQPGNGILVINLTSHFGDGVMLLPMLQAIHEANPGVPIDIACSKGVDGMFAAVPFLRNIYAAPLDSKPPITLRAAINRRRGILRWYREALRDVHPQVCLMPRWGDDLFGSIFLAYLIGAPQRIGFASTVDTHQRTAPQRDAMLTQAVEGGSGLHEPLRFLRVAQQGGLIPADRIFRTDIVSAALQQVAASVDWPNLRDRLALPQDKPLAVLAPGASSPNKTWPQDHWIGASRQILDAGFHIVLLSGNADRAYAEAIGAALNDSRVHLVAGATTLPESIALMGHAAIFLGNDSGPGHAAGALGVPSAILFVSSEDVYPDNSFSAVRIRPMGPCVRALHPTLMDACRNACLMPVSHCIGTISADVAVSALLALYQQKLHALHPPIDDASR